ncbi:heavy-metal-associated domain-containing protein [Frankia sp. CiP3]|uniref:heavy-metal-associated domain-containing protein n=1 Tax=Frankia sp. CiP3 TaxID=2880971 RepID=UPI001EF5B660|nr:heavy metal-associated domain-containing protein [Frankia sp. CiP3]
MTCAACARRVEKASNRRAGAWATVSLATHRAMVTWSDGREPDPEVLAAAVEQAGDSGPGHSRGCTGRRRAVGSRRAQRTSLASTHARW